MTLDDQLFFLLDLGKKIAYEKDLHSLLKILDDAAREMLGCDRCSIFLYDDSAGELWTTVAHGVDEIRIPAAKGVAGTAALSKEIQIVVDAYNDFRFNPDVDKETGYVTKTILAVPLTDSQQNVVGVFQALNKREGVFSSKDGEMLLLLGNYAGSALENAILYRKLKETHAKVIMKLSSAAEFKDNETHAHTKRVGLYSALIARKLELPDPEIELIRLTAPMHDVGKIGIPDAILRKPGKLDDTELSTMRTHCDIGYDILHDPENDLLQTAALVAKEHHERYDGNGYPEGLSQEGISVYGRIAAIADVFDALTTRRPYKEPWPFEDAVEYLRSERGKHFDPAMIDLFMESLEEVREIYRSYQDPEAR